MGLTKTAQDTIQRIANAFEDRILPNADPVFQSYTCEVDMRVMARLAHQTTWFDFPGEVVCNNPLALAFMTPEAFAWFLPAYLVRSISPYRGADSLTTTILTCLTPPDAADASTFQSLVEQLHALNADIIDEAEIDSLGPNDRLLQLFLDRASVLDDCEKAAVRDYLEYMDATHGADFPVFGPKDALDRYWTRTVESSNR